MKIPVFIAFLFSVSTMSYAQDEKKQMTVRVKKIEKINGVETVSDTTYLSTADDPDNNMTLNSEITKIRVPDIALLTKLAENKDTAALRKLFPGKACSITVLDDAEGNFKDMSVMADHVLLAERNNGSEAPEIKSERVIIIRRSAIADLSASEKTQMKKVAGETDNRLSVNNMNFYPNPGNGRFNLSFDLPEKGNTVISIFNVEGKSVYEETLNNFQGHYQKEIDISAQPKGAYFVRLQQNEHASLKKIILE